ncbi:MAG TPA: P-loop NTPase fold protein, partial [Candidatus Thermoplasmatota archaeon]|nr:P-loop NTPase fold protein [Candidatus Thermoplasmatota archaeon]
VWDRAFIEERLRALEEAAQRVPVHATPEEASPEEIEAAGLGMVGDRPWRRGDPDHLEYAHYAEALASLIDNEETATPLTLSINAAWGAGKSSLGEMVRQRIDRREPDAIGRHVVCWFNAWMHDEAGHLSGAFVAQVAQTAARGRARWRRLIEPLPLRFAPPRWRLAARALALGALALAAGALALLAHALLPGSVAIPAWAAAVAAGGGPQAWATVAAVGIGALLPSLWNAWKAVAEFVRDPEEIAGGGSMPKVRASLGRLIRQATAEGGRFVVFVDDLDRVRPPRAVELLETVNQLLDHEGVVVVFLADMPAVHAHVEAQYEELAKRHPAADYGRLYVQKIVQVQFDLPPPAEDLNGAFARRVAAPPSRQAPRSAPERALLAVGRAARRLTRATRRLARAARILVERGQRDLAKAAEAVWRAGVLLLFVTVVYNGLRGGAAPWELAVVAGVTLVAFAAYELVQRARTLVYEEARAELDKTIASEGVDAAEVLAHDAVIDAEEWSKLKAERQALHIANKTEFVDKAIAAALQHVPALPRHVKRVVNRTRLLAVIAKRRGLRISSAVLGKWVALQERWPRLAAEVTNDFRLLHDLETSLRTHPALRERAARLVHGEVAALERFLEADPQLRDSAQTLALLRAA